ncbi:MAG: hypothetical protein ACXVGA_03640 [Mycobacteriaceae bacterium]
MNLHCGRLDAHEPHDWHTPPSPHKASQRDYHCDGQRQIEGGHWGEWDMADDAAEEREMQEAREAS